MRTISQDAQGIFSPVDAPLTTGFSGGVGFILAFLGLAGMTFNYRLVATPILSSTIYV